MAICGHRTCPLRKRCKLKRSILSMSLSGYGPNLQRLDRAPRYRDPEGDMPLYRRTGCAGGARAKICLEKMITYGASSGTPRRQLRVRVVCRSWSRAAAVDPQFEIGVRGGTGTTAEPRTTADCNSCVRHGNRCNRRLACRLERT